MRCDVFVGRIISHPCGARAVGKCAQCATLMCQEHADAASGSDAICVCCAGTYTPPPGVRRVNAEQMYRISDEDYALFAARGKVGHGIFDS